MFLKEVGRCELMNEHIQGLMIWEVETVFSDLVANNDLKGVHRFSPWVLEDSVPGSVAR